jgi:hypothetical protein
MFFFVSHGLKISRMNVTEKRRQAGGIGGLQELEKDSLTQK